MSVLPDSEVKQEMQKCVTRPKPDGKLRSCKRCHCLLPLTFGAGRPRNYCKACNPNDNVWRTMEREIKGELKIALSSLAFKYANRDRYIPINFGIGTYTGPLNKSVTWKVGLVKDKGFQAMPIDVHVEGPAPKFTQVTPEDVDWGNRQGRPAQTMPRKFNNFCTTCVEMVIDGSQRSVRVTKGVYLPIEHKCNSVRVYNLNGELLEIKPL